MRISISGTHCTGKTTLVEACRTEFATLCPGDSAVITEVARGVIARGFPLNQDATTDSYYNYIRDQLLAERRTSCRVVVSDRSLIDLLAYIRTNANQRISGQLVAMLEEVIWRERKYFDLYCYLPPEFPLVVDDVRPEEEHYRTAVDRELVAIMCEYGVPVLEVRGDHMDRLRTVLSCICG